MLKKYLKLFSLGTLFFLSFTVHAESIADLFRHKGDPIAGNPHGTVTVVEFFDYQCSHCSNMATIIQQIKQTNPNVRFVFKDFPIRGPLSHFAALAAIAANKQHKYYDFSHALLQNSPSTEEAVLAIANNISGLNIATLKKDMESNEIKKQLAANITLARNLNLNGTPAFFIGKTNARTTAEVNYFLGELSRSELQEAINKANS